MYLRIYWGKIVPASWDLIEQRYADLMSVQTEGLLGRFVTQDTNDPDSMFTITLWRDMESLKEWEDSSAYKEVFLGAIAPYLMGSHSVSLCKVKLEDIRGFLAQGLASN